MNPNYNAGMVRPDGSSSSPLPGVFDMVEGADLVQLAEEAEAQLKLTMGELLGSKNITAKYKLEVLFSERSLDKPYDGMIYAFTNGGQSHGGGDQSVYFCPQPHLTEQGRYCAGVLEHAFVDKKRALCPKCKRAMNPRRLAGQVCYKKTLQGWTSVLLNAYRALDCNATIQIHTFVGDLREATALEQEKEHRGDKLRKVRLDRITVEYTLARIIEDVSAGSSLEARFRAFLKA